MLSERRGIIGRSTVDPNKGNETLFTNLALPSVLAYDWISNNIYVASRVSPGKLLPRGESPSHLNLSLSLTFLSVL